jgi:CheY-like chemotaxis protein
MRRSGAQAGSHRESDSSQADLIVLDFQMPVMNGLVAAPMIRKHVPNVRLILFTLYIADAIESAAHAAGIHAVVAKDRPHLLVPTVHSLLHAIGPAGHSATA